MTVQAAKRVPGTKNKFGEPQSVAFDVDGTLIDAEDNPRQDVITLLKAHFYGGDDVFVWSGGGQDYARRWVERLELSKYVVAAFPKNRSLAIDVTYDDQIITLGREENVCVGSGDHEERW